MNPRIVELALRKQRLQLESAALREAIAVDAAAFAPAFGAADKVHEGARWLGRHPEWLAGGAAVLLVARPRVLLRWLRRGFFAWQLWRKLGHIVDWRPAAALRL